MVLNKLTVDLMEMTQLNSTPKKSQTVVSYHQSGSDTSVELLYKEFLCPLQPLNFMRTSALLNKYIQ